MIETRKGNEGPSRMALARCAHRNAPPARTRQLRVTVRIIESKIQPLSCERHALRKHRPKNGSAHHS